jgi:hypothetical protein
MANLTSHDGGSDSDFKEVTTQHFAYKLRNVSSKKVPQAPYSSVLRNADWRSQTRRVET